MIIWWLTCTYFYPRPPRGGRRRQRSDSAGSWSISIHALREEGDVPSWETSPMVSAFLSTPSARRATKRGAVAGDDVVISIHALREEGDGSCTGTALSCGYFYPRPPRGGRQPTANDSGLALLFLSTPSARRATGHVLTVQRGGKVFLSTPSARRATVSANMAALTFQAFLSTPSARRATV